MSLRSTGSMALALIGCGLVAACTSGPVDPQPLASPVLLSAGPSTAATSSVPALQLSEAPLWTRAVRKHYGDTPQTAPIAELSDIYLAGDAVLTIGSVPDDRGTDRLVVSDAKTGAVRWSATRGERVGGDGSTYDFLRSARVLGDPAGDWTVVTTFVRRLAGTNVEEGIIGLSGKDGSLRWRIPVQRANRCNCPWTRIEVMLLGPADAGTVTVEILTETTAQGQVATRTLAYDSTTQRQIWTAAGVRPKAIAGGLLLAERPKFPAKSVDTPPATLSALDLRTGAVRWDMAGRSALSYLTYAAGDTLLANRGGTTTVVDTATGRELGTSPTDLTSCDRTPEVFACLDADAKNMTDKAVTVRRGEATATVAKVPGSQWCARIRVWRALLYCDDASNEPRRSAAVDSAGAVAAARLPGRLEAVNDDFAVFSTGSFVDDQGAFAVYATD